MEKMNSGKTAPLASYLITVVVVVLLQIIGGFIVTRSTGFFRLWTPVYFLIAQFAVPILFLVAFALYTRKWDLFAVGFFAMLIYPLIPTIISFF